MPSYIKTTHQDRVTSITIDRSADGNRLSNAMALDLIASLEAARDQAVVVLTAAGTDFCLGRDMEPPKPGSNVSATDVLRDDAAPMMAMYDAFRRRKGLTVCAVTGRAWGIGLVLAALCDVTIATVGSSYRLRELERGIPPCIALAPLLDLMPAKVLSYLVLSAEEMDAQTALMTGAISRVVPEADLDISVSALVERLLGFPQDAVAVVRQYLATAPRHQPVSAEQYGASLLANVLASR